MDFRDYLKENAQKVDKQLSETLLEFLKETKKTNTKLLPFAQKFKNSCKGGKRIRGVLCKMGYELTNSVTLSTSSVILNKAKGIYSSPQNDILKVGAAFEILHTALLIHDDIIDQSPQRRGQPSLYMALGGNHYGVSQAISLGDIGLYLPIKIITQTSFSAEVKIKALNYFSQMLINTGWGQVMDMEKSPVDSSSKDPDKQSLLLRNKKFVNLFKTAKYTIAGPLQLGAILAGAKESLVKKLGEFGESLGIAFQIQDDILDGEIDSADARSQALQYASKAKKIIPKVTQKREMVRILRDLTEYLINRDK